MRGKFRFYALYVLMLVIHGNCVQVFEETDENVPTTVESEKQKNSNVTQSSLDISSTESGESLQSRNLEQDEDYRIITSSTSTTTPAYKIPPTLQNVNHDDARSTSERSTSSARDVSNPSPAQFNSKNLGQSIDAKVKQAVIGSKQQAFKNLNYINPLNTKNDYKKSQVADQVAKPNEVQSDISKETPTTAVPKEFYPSPEVASLFNRENKPQDHFAPMNQYYRPAQQDARFPPYHHSSQSPFSGEPVLDTRWLGGSRPPQPETLKPLDIMHPPPQQHTFGRNTNIEFPPYSSYNPSPRHHHLHHQSHFSGEEKISFPEEDTRLSRWPFENHVVPALNFKQPKGSWKWIPDDEADSRNSSELHTIEYDSKLGPQTFPDSTRPPITREHPYSFENYHKHPFGFTHSQYPTGPAVWSSGSDSLSTEETTESGLSHEEPSKSGHLDVKSHRGPSPWKRILHVMTAAIPIGIIISALTPRIVFVHPNATVPTLQPPLQHNPALLPPQQPGQINGPFNQQPFRQRSVLTQQSVDESISQFLKMMELQFREKHQRNGEKHLDGTCEDRFFCEVALKGRMPHADALHRMLYNVALETPNADAVKSGLGEIFTAVKRQNCDVFKCKKL